MVARAWNFYTMLVLYFFHAKSPGCTIYYRHIHVSTACPSDLWYSAFKALFLLSRICLREFAVLEGKTSMSEFPPASSVLFELLHFDYLNSERCERDGFQNAIEYQGFRWNKLRVLFVPFVAFNYDLILMKVCLGVREYHCFKEKMLNEFYTSNRIIPSWYKCKENLYPFIN